MGMYTELIFGACLTLKKDDTTIVPILQHMCDKTMPKPTKLPNHPFFRTDRWDWMLRSGSYYFVGMQTPLLEWDEIGKYFRLMTRSNLKNYTGEIVQFLNWIKPYIEKGTGTRDFYAIVTYEEDDEPTIYYLKDKES